MSQLECHEHVGWHVVLASQPELLRRHEAEARIVLGVAEHDDALYASSAAADESLADQDTPDALLLVAGRNRHWRQADQRRIVGVLDGHRGEQDVPDDRCADLRDERDDDCVRAVQGFDDVGFLTPAEGVFVERADDVPVARLFNPE